MVKPSGDANHVNGFHHDNWESLLLKVDGKLRERSAQNAIVLFSHHPDVGPNLAFNTFSNQAVMRAAVPWDIRGLKYPRQVDDSDGIKSLGWLEQQGLYKLSTGTAKDALIAGARASPFNPLVDWLQSIIWDKQPRIDGWLTYYLGTAANDYTRAVGRKFLISAVARALRPGCKVDTMLILEGPQGRLKSSAARVLFGAEWFTDDLAEIGTKDAALQMQGRWGIEVPEMSSFTKTETNKIKATLSRPIDRFRAPYDRFISEHPRQCVLIGTTNPLNGYFKDPTGARRFWPVECGTIDLEALTHDCEQLWAEAVAAFESGASWWLTNEEQILASVEQALRQESDPWTEAIAKAILGRTMVTSGELLRETLGFKIGDTGRGDEMRVAAVLSYLGWERKRTMMDGERAWRWVCPTDTLPFDEGRAP